MNPNTKYIFFQHFKRQLLGRPNVIQLLSNQVNIADGWFVFRQNTYDTEDEIITYITKDEGCTKEAFGCSQIRMVQNVSRLPFWLLFAFLENLGFARPLQTNIAHTCLPHFTTVILFLLLCYNF